MYVIVTYDVSDDRRRTRLHELLLGYGSPVQFSVFECDLEPAQLAILRRRARRFVRPPRDSIRYYQLCAACARRTSTGGTSLTARIVEDIVV